MFASWLNLALAFGSLFGIGFVIKMMDDVFDADYDVCFGIRTLAAKLGKRVLPYSIVAGLFAALCNVHLALGVFLASYGVSAISRPREHQLRMEPYIEFVVAVILCFAAMGPNSAIWAIMMMCAVDWLGNIGEMNKDKQSGQRNIALQFGVVVTLFAILIALSIAVFFNAQWTVLTFTAFSLLAIFFDLTSTALALNWNSV